MKSVLLSVGFAGLAYAGVAKTLTSTVQTTTSQACYGAVATHAPGFQCNIAGTLEKPSLITSAVGQKLQDCQELCLFDEECLTFGYNKKSDTCEIHKKNLKQMKIDPSVSSGFVYSNRHCVACDTTPPSSSSSSKVTKTNTKSTSSTGKPRPTKTKSTSSTGKPKPTNTKSQSSSSTGKPGKSSTSSKASSSSSSSTKPHKTKTHMPTATGVINGHATCTEDEVAIPQSTQVYKRYFVGSGVTENINNPGNRNIQQAPINSTLPGSYASDCDAIAACAYDANYASFQYFSFDLHYVSSTQQWICTQYYDPNTQASYFNQKNDDVVVAYGFYNPNF